MENNLRVTPEELMNKANALESKAKEIKTVTDKIYNTMNDYSAQYWKSAGVDKAKAKVTTMYEGDMQDIQKLIAERVKDLRTMAGQFDISDDNAAKDISSLEEDVITY